MTTLLIEAQKALSEHFEMEVSPLGEEDDSFSLQSGYPCNPHVPKRTYETQVDWNKDDRLCVSTGVDGAVFAPWPGMETFLDTLNRRITLLLPEPDGGRGRITTFDSPHDKSKKALGHQAIFRCKKGEERLLHDHILPVFLWTMQALHYVHPIFRYIAATGEVPDAMAQMRLMLIEYGLNEIYRPLTDPEKESGAHVYLPPGLYGGVETLPMQ